MERSHNTWISLIAWILAPVAIRLFAWGFYAANWINIVLSILEIVWLVIAIVYALDL